MTLIAMKRVTNRDRILSSAIDLFNKTGVVAVTTNHIAHELSISPGNLYFHFRNKEEIIRELFDRMSDEIYALWKSKSGLETYASPIELIEGSFEVFWKYRFFHREMYHLRRKDPSLARKWRTHMNKTVRLLTATYRYWVRTGVMVPIEDPGQMRMVSDLVLITSSSFLQFYESPDRPATKRSVQMAVKHILRLLLPYMTDRLKNEVLKFLAG